LYKYHGSISKFLDVSIRRLMLSIQQSSVRGSFVIGEHLQYYSWQIGRLDLVAKEFQVVQRRYGGRLNRKNGDIFSLLVEFQSDSTKIISEFVIEPTLYPSLPVEVRLDLISGELNLKSLQKSLVKDAKPGFGSLLKACGIIQSIIV